jgi:hypothetical protein
MHHRLRLRRGEPRHGQRIRACSGTGPGLKGTHSCAGLVPFPGAGWSRSEAALTMLAQPSGSKRDRGPGRAPGRDGCSRRHCATLRSRPQRQANLGLAFQSAPTSWAARPTVPHPHSGTNPRPHVAAAQPRRDRHRTRFSRRAAIPQMALANLSRSHNGDFADLTVYCPASCRIGHGDGRAPGQQDRDRSPFPTVARLGLFPVPIGATRRSAGKGRG